MLSEYSNKQQPPNHVPSEQANEAHCPYSTARQERTLKALTLLLGPETAYATRLRATRYLARQGSAVLPLLLSTLHHYPELISPPWPGWPPQYEQCSRLLIHLCQDARLSLDALLQHPVISQPAGPVLWTSVIEAVDAQPDAAYESLLCNGLVAPWETTRYAAAMALANLTSIGPLHESTRAALHICQSTQEPVSVRLAASYTLLRCGDSSGCSLLACHLCKELHSWPWKRWHSTKLYVLPCGNRCFQLTFCRSCNQQARQYVGKPVIPWLR